MTRPLSRVRGPGQGSPAGAHARKRKRERDKQKRDAHEDILENMIETRLTPVSPATAAAIIELIIINRFWQLAGERLWNQTNIRPA